MSKPHFRSVWISDVHLCTRDCQVDLLYRFLKQIKCEYLYIVGDFVDIWSLKRRWYWPRTYNDVIRRVLKMVRKGTRVYYVPGNHDELVRDYHGHEFGGVEIRRQVEHVTADGRRLLVLHGDQFDMVIQCRKWLSVLGSAAYDYLIFLNTFVNWVRRKFNLPYYSLSGAIKRRVKRAVSYERNFEEAVVREARTHGYAGVVCGHIHNGQIREIGGVHYYNCGDWIENCTALVEDDTGRISLVRYMDEWQTWQEGEPEQADGLDLPDAGAIAPDMVELPLPR